MSNLNELIGSLTNENVEEVKEKLLSEASAKDKVNSQLYHRAKKAEGFEKIKGEWVKKEVKPEPKNKPAEKLGEELDYGKKTFISSVLGVKLKNEEEMKVVNEYLANGKTLEDLEDNKHFQNDLKDLRDAKSVEDALPSGDRRSAPSTAKNTVEFWVAKGELPPADQIKLRRDVVNARYNSEKNVSPFGSNKK